MIGLTRRNHVWVASAIVLISLLPGTPCRAQGPIYRFRQHGDFAQVNTNENTPTGSRSVFISVSRDESSGGSQTSVSYSTFTFDFATASSIQHSGYGPIPNESLVVDDSRKEYGFQLNINAVPGFYSYDYVCNSSGCITTSPSSVPDSNIAVLWSKSNESWLRTEGHGRSQIGDLILRFQGTTVSHGATLSGKIFGEDLGSDAIASVGTSQNTNMSVQAGH
jgi:hypothetical protein